MGHIKHKSGKTELQRRTCQKEGCSKYFPTLKALEAHTKLCTGFNIEDEVEDLDLYMGDDILGYE